MLFLISLFHCPGWDHRQGCEAFFRIKIGGAALFRKKIRGAETFFEKSRGAHFFRNFFTTKFENPRFHFSKKCSMLGHVTRVCSLAYDTCNKYIESFSWLCVRLFSGEIKKGAKSFFRKILGGRRLFFNLKKRDYDFFSWWSNCQIEICREFWKKNLD